MLSDLKNIIFDFAEMRGVLDFEVQLDEMVAEDEHLKDWVRKQYFNACLGQTQLRDLPLFYWPEEKFELIQAILQVGERAMAEFQRNIRREIRTHISDLQDFEVPSDPDDF